MSLLSPLLLSGKGVFQMFLPSPHTWGRCNPCLGRLGCFYQVLDTLVRRRLKPIPSLAGCRAKLWLAGVPGGAGGVV